MLKNIRNALMNFTIEELEEFYVMVYNYAEPTYTKLDYSNHILRYFQQDLIDRKNILLPIESRRTRTLKAYLTISWFTQKCSNK